jgi:hypothetical protein
MQNLASAAQGIAAMALVTAQLAPMPVALAPIAAAPAAAQQYQTISCYARGSGRTNCSIPRGVQSVRFVGPDRSMRCREGQTWGWSGTRLWVAQGCGGNFELTTADASIGFPPVVPPIGRPPGGSWGDYAGRVTCSAPRGGSNRCDGLNTQGRVTLVRNLGSRACVENSTWGHDRVGIWVTDGCSGEFAYGTAGQGGPGWGGPGWGGQQGQGFAGELRCQSDRNRERFCRANTQNRVMLVRQRSGAACVEGQTWRVEAGGIRVRGGCDGQFAYGFGNFYPDGWQTGGGWQQEPDRGGGTNVGGIIAGGLLAAGLVALLSQAGRSGKAEGSGSAQLSADMNAFPDRSRREAQACLNEAARQVGATGGTSVRLDRVTGSQQQAGGGWRHEAQLTGTWPDHSQRMSMDCIASGDRVSAFDVR